MGSLQGCCNLPVPINITTRPEELRACNMKGKERKIRRKNMKLIKILYPIRLYREYSHGLEAAAERSEPSLCLIT